MGDNLHAKMIRDRCNSKQIYVLLSPLKSVGLEQRNFVRTALKDSQREGDMREVYKTMYGKETEINISCSPRMFRTPYQAD